MLGHLRDGRRGARVEGADEHLSYVVRLFERARASSTLDSKSAFKVFSSISTPYIWRISASDVGAHLARLSDLGGGGRPSAAAARADLDAPRLRAHERRRAGQRRRRRCGGTGGGKVLGSSGGLRAASVRQGVARVAARHIGDCDARGVPGHRRGRRAGVPSKIPAASGSSRACGRHSGRLRPAASGCAPISRADRRRWHPAPGRRRCPNARRAPRVRCWSS